MPSDWKTKQVFVYVYISAVNITFSPLYISRRFSWRQWPDAQLREVAIAYAYLAAEEEFASYAVRVVKSAVCDSLVLCTTVTTTSANEAYMVRSVNAIIWEDMICNPREFVYLFLTLVFAMHTLSAVCHVSQVTARFPGAKETSDCSAGDYFCRRSTFSHLFLSQLVVFNSI